MDSESKGVGNLDLTHGETKAPRLENENVKHGASGGHRRDVSTENGCERELCLCGGIFGWHVY